MITIGIITASDKGSRGERTDTSGPLIEEIVKDVGGVVKEYAIVADEKQALVEKMKYMCDELNLHLVLTTGGTGFSLRDVTPEATLEVIERQVPGIPEAIRMKSLSITPKAMLSRAVAGIRNQTLIINLPGSPKGVRESLEVVLPAISHGIGILRGVEGECGNEKK